MQIEDLPRIRFRANWKLSSVSRRDFLIRSMGDQLDTVASGLASSLRNAASPEARLGFAARVPNHPGTNRTLRLVDTLKPLHDSKVDVCLVRRAPDLFVRISAEARSWLTYLRYAYTGLLAWAVLLLLSWLFLSYTGAFAAIVDDAVRQLTPSAVEAAVAQRYGFVLDPVTQKWVRAAPVTILQVLRNNPRLAFAHLATPLAVIAGAAGLVAFLAQKLTFETLCHLLGWPTPQELDDFATANGAWVTGAVSQTLADFGITEVDKLAT